ncbi:uncharacterized protein [Nicotiana tomentosiformis]|uniref:uncharacterized protein n=1 Tax=Nicotiana tomentosiformis TaxID=4098 RepID=UPI00388C9ED1
MGVQEILVLGDSDLLVYQIQGEWETRDLKLIPYRQCLHDLCQRFRSVEFRHIPRIHNKIVDALATLASMLHHPDKAYVDPLHIRVRDQNAYCNVIEEELDGEPWFHDVKEYIKSGIYLVHATGDQKRTIRRLARGFFLSGGILYKRTPDLGLLRCIGAKQASTIMVGVHSGVCGPHMSGYVLAKKILRAAYYWLTMERDCISFVHKCHQCQVHGDLIHSLPSELHTISVPWPFVAWGMDVIGPIEPAVSNGHRFILVAIDYFTKWVEAVTFKSVTKKAVVHFVHSNIIFRFRIPKVIITDNVANLNSHLMKEILRKMVQGSRQWHEKLPFALLGYRTIVCTSVGATPYLLVYGTEAVLPTEAEIPSLRIIAEAEIDDDEWVKTRLEQLSLIDEKRLAAAEAKGKFAPNWQGPFIMTKVLPNGALYLTDIEGALMANNEFGNIIVGDVEVDDDAMDEIDIDDTLEETQEDVNPSRDHVIDIPEMVVQKSKAPLPKPPPPYSQRLAKKNGENQFEKFIDMMKSLSINVSLVEALEQIPGYAKFMKDLVTKNRSVNFETIKVTHQVSTIVHSMAPKLEYLGAFTITYTIGSAKFAKALCDLGRVST